MLLLQEHRKRLNSTIKIQAYVRSYLIRKHCKQNEREQFDAMFPRASTDEQMSISDLIIKILFFYDHKQDTTRLVKTSEFYGMICTKH